jgi:hypothetical protein
VQARPVARKIGAGGNAGPGTEKARLDNFAHQLQHEYPDAQGYIVAYGGRRGTTGEAQTSADLSKNYLNQSL